MVVLTRRRLEYVTIKPEGDGSVPGHCAWFKSLVWDQDYDSRPGDYRKEIQRILAGPIAEKIGMSEDEVGDHCNADIQIAYGFTKIMTASRPEMARRTVPELEDEARRSLYAIRDEVEQTLISKWDVVEAVANALLEQETLKGKQVRQLVESVVIAGETEGET